MRRAVLKSVPAAWPPGQGARESLPMSEGRPQPRLPGWAGGGKVGRPRAPGGSTPGGSRGLGLGRRR